MFADARQFCTHIMWSKVLHDLYISIHNGLFLNPSNTKYIHINPSANYSIHSSDGIQIEKVETFKYIGSYTNYLHDIQCRKTQAWQQLTRLTKFG